jgi:protein-S-isoprenylcysteine O-methyltransferase Ste14
MERSMIPYSRVILDGWAAWFAYWLVMAALNRKPDLRRESQASYRSWRLLTVAAWIFLFSPIRLAGLDARLLPATDFWGGLGLGLAVAGLLYTVWARVVLGSNWSSTVTVKERHQLIVAGPYRFTRHPIYTGLITAALGTAVASGEQHAVLGAGFLVWAFELKLRVEERFMRDQFGGVYEEYCAHVKRLVPFIY